MQATARMASVVSSTLPARRRLIRSVRPTTQRPAVSDHWVAVIPRDPEYVPSSSQAKAALAYLRELATESDEVTFTTDDRILFRDCGENLESISCPICSAALDQDWWSDRMAKDHDGQGFYLRPIRLPCCGGDASLNQLLYSFDQGFSRFILEAMNPNIGRLDDQQVARLSDLLGAPLRVIYQHI